MRCSEIGSRSFCCSLYPGLFFLIVAATTRDGSVAFILASISGDTLIEVNALEQSLVFIGVAAVGLVSAFLAMTLIQGSAEQNRRLVLCGYGPTELLLSKLFVLAFATCVIALYVSLILLVFFIPRHFVMVVAGFALAGFVHACYGLLIGSIVRRQLEGILLIVLLVNIDAGWLQNPVFFADAHNKMFIRVLPAYFPSQVSVVSAFTDHPIGMAATATLIYAGVLLLASAAVYFWRMRVKRRG